MFRVENGILRVDYSKFAAFNGRFGHLFYKEKLLRTFFILNIDLWAKCCLMHLHIASETVA